MIAWCTVAVALAADPADVDAGAFAAVGEALGGGTVARVQLHPEFERYWLDDGAGGALPVEIVRADGVHHGVCPRGEYEVFPRPELSPHPASLDATAFCPRLAAPRAGPGATPQGTTPLKEASFLPPARSYSAVHGIAIAAAFTTLLTIVRSRAAFHLSVLLPVVAALLGVWIAGPATVFNGAGAGWEKLVEANGLVLRPPYGLGYGTMMSPFVAALGEGVDTIFTANRWFHVATAAATWALVRGEADPRTATLAALTWAMLPVPARLGASEAMHVSATLLCVASLACAGAWRRGNRFGGLAAALLAGLAVHTRPEMLALLPVVVMMAWPRWGVVEALVLVAIVALRLVDVSLPPPVVQAPVKWSPLTLVMALSPHLGAQPSGVLQVFWTRIFTPMGLWPLALLGLWRADRALRLRLLTWIVVLGGPMVFKSWPYADAMRLQAPVQPAWAVLVGFGAMGLGRYGPAFLLLCAMSRPTLPVWVQAREANFLRAVVPTLGNVTVRYDDTPHRAPKFGAVMETLGPAKWRGDEGTLQYRGVSCHLEGAGPNCTVSGCPVQVVHLPPDADVDLSLPPEGIDIGFWGPCPP